MNVEPPSGPPPVVDTLQADHRTYRQGGRPGTASGAGWPRWARPYVSPAARAVLLLVSLTAVIVGCALSTLGILLGRFRLAPADLVELVLDLGLLLLLVAYPIAVVTLCTWMHRAYRNLPALGGTALRFSPRWAVGWWFVPVMNFWRPYQVMREIWLESSPYPAGWGPVQWWWALGLVGGWLSARAAFPHLNPSIDLVANTVHVTAALLAIVVVRQITDWQAETAALEEAGSRGRGMAALGVEQPWRGAGVVVVVRAAPGPVQPGRAALPAGARRVPLDGRLRPRRDASETDADTDTR